MDLFTLIRKLITTTGEIPIGIYRKLDEHTVHYERHNSKMENIKQMILIKMDKLGIDSNKYSSSSETDSVNFVLINPSNEFLLQSSDIIYLLKPGTPVIQPENPSQVVFGLNETTTDIETDEETAKKDLLKYSPSFTTPLNSPKLTNTLSESMKAYLNLDNSDIDGDGLMGALTTKTVALINTEDEDKLADIVDNCRF